MNIRKELQLLFQVTRSYALIRRYFVVNGFDGALTMLGIIVGFYFSENANIIVVVSACLGAAIALGMSGISSAYVSESAERQQELRELQAAMLTNLSESTHARAAKLVPFAIAFINGAAPLMACLIIISPLWLASSLTALSINPLLISIVTAFFVIFLLGVFLGKVSGKFWLTSGIRTLLVGLLTCIIIFLLSPN